VVIIQKLSGTAIVKVQELTWWKGRPRWFFAGFFTVLL
jgi:hypothetical protein